MDDPVEIYTPAFDYDGLRTDPAVIHNHDFMRDARYVRAYRAADKALGYDHRMYWRLHVALWCASQCRRLPGEFVECGVWRGFLTSGILNYLDWQALGKSFYLFDTFDGLQENLLTPAEAANRSKIEHLNRHFAGEFARARQNFAAYPRVHLIRGVVPDSLRTVDIGQVCYLSLDLNCVEPELAAANYFWERMPPGAMILLDDYGFVSYEEQKRGFDAFAADKGVEILALPTGQGLIMRPDSAAPRPVRAIERWTDFMKGALRTAAPTNGSGSMCTAPDVRPAEILTRAERVIAAALRHQGDTPAGIDQDVQRLATHYYGYKGAYETLNAEVGGLRAECERLKAEIAELRSRPPSNEKTATGATQFQTDHND